MANTIYQFRPCNCCVEPDIGLIIERERASRNCQACGFRPTGGNNSTTTSQIDCNFGVPPPDLKSWTRSSRYNIPPNNTILFQKYILSQSWASYPCDAAITESHFTTEFFDNGTQPNCNSGFNVLAASEGCCPGQDRNRVDIWTTPAKTCQLPEYGPWTGTGDVCASFSVSPYGDFRTQSKIRFRFSHRPTATCYLKIWFRAAINSTGGNVFSNYEDIKTYTWEGSGNPCFEDPNKLYTDEDNRIKEDEWEEIEVFYEGGDAEVAFDGWANELSEAADNWLASGDISTGDISLAIDQQELPQGFGGSVTKCLEYKYSLIKDYEPDWP